MEDLKPTMRAHVASNTSIKMCGGVSSSDARQVANDLRSTPDFLLSQVRDSRDRRNPQWTNWATSGLDTTTQYAGFSAQNVQTAIPEAIGSSTNGYLTLQDRPLIAAVVNAIKELAQQFSDFAERIPTKELVAVNGRFDEVDARTLCLGSTCVTESQLQAMLAAASQSVSPLPRQRR